MSHSGFLQSTISTRAQAYTKEEGSVRARGVLRLRGWWGCIMKTVLMVMVMVTVLAVMVVMVFVTWCSHEEKFDQGGVSG